MGRRFLLIFGIMLLALSTAPAVRGQVEDPKSTGGVAGPPVDENVVKAQATAPAAGQPAGATEPRLPTADRLPLGKQSVAVTVDVQAPASMNLSKNATLKLIVRNTGVGGCVQRSNRRRAPRGPQVRLESARDEIGRRWSTLDLGPQHVAGRL